MLRFLLLVLLLGAVACAQAPGAPDLPAETAACQAAETPQVQAGIHLIGDREPPIPYSSVPPTSGAHSAAPPKYGVADEPLTEPEQVTVLETGGVVISYRDLPPEDVARLEDLARGPLRGEVAVTPYAELDPGAVALTAWGVLQRCEAVDVQAIQDFADSYANEVGH